MENQDRKSFALLINALAASFGRDADEALLEGMWLGLRDLPLRALEQAVTTALRQCQYMPKAVELRQLAGEMTAATRAVHAWGVLSRAIGQHGAYRSVNFDDPVLNATVRNLGGWVRLCGMPTEEFEKWTRKEFDRIYSALCSGGVPGEQTRHLAGIHELSNSAAGHQVTAPTHVATGLPPHREGTVRELEQRQAKALPLTGEERTALSKVFDAVNDVAAQIGGVA
jgi:hypothetical protein